MRVFDQSKVCTCSHCAFTAQFSYRKLLSSLAKYELSHRWPCVSRRPATVIGSFFIGTTISGHHSL